MFSCRLLILGRQLSWGVIFLGHIFSSGDSFPSSAEPNVHIHSRLLFRLPCGVVGANSASSTFKVPCDDDTLPRFWLESLASESDDDSSTTGVGINSTRLLRKTTRLLGGKISFDDFADVARRRRLDKGLLRRILRGTMELVYGIDCENGDVSPDAGDGAKGEASGVNASATLGGFGALLAGRFGDGDLAA